MLALAVMAPLRAGGYDPAEKSVAALRADLAAGKVTAEELVQAYLDRIAKLDQAGPGLHSVIALNPAALSDAKAVDRARRARKKLGPLAGIPVLLKDNIESKDEMATTAGSLALKDNITHRDAPLVARLRAAGAIILGKTNLSEWANIRASMSISGWSALGGLTKNPYVLDRNACGSSAGSGTAAAASLAAVTIGTETDGSITCPSSITGVVGLKPTIGLVSRTHIVPISASQDTAGPMTRSVADAAAVLSVIAGSDPADPATAEADKHKTDYSAALAGASLKGLRLGVLQVEGQSTSAAAVGIFAANVALLKAQGAEIVVLKPVKVPDAMGEAELTVLLTELKSGLNAYLASVKVPVHSLAEVIAFNARTPRETVLFGQDLFEKAQETDGDASKARAESRDIARGLLDGLLAANKLDALITATSSPSWRIDLLRGDRSAGESATLAAVAGYPHLTVPMGYTAELPVGLSFIGPAWSEAKLLAIGQAYEQVSKARKPPRYLTSLEAESAAALAPADYLMPK